MRDSLVLLAAQRAALWVFPVSRPAPTTTGKPGEQLAFSRNPRSAVEVQTALEERQIGRFGRELARTRPTPS